ncbi:hypothetical protein FM106_21215 [Brachybacterium faecium]|nr:hypothetical protein FM106_21215 [Brachybacterium faecium]
MEKKKTATYMAVKMKNLFYYVESSIAIKCYSCPLRFLLLLT